MSKLQPCYFCGEPADKRKTCPERPATSRFPYGKRHVNRIDYLGRPFS